MVLANPSASDADPDIQECHRCKPVSCRPCRPDSSTERTRHRCRLYRCISIDTGSRAASHRNSKCGSRAGNGDHNLRRDRFTADWSSAKGCFSCFSLALHAGCGVQSSWPEPIGNPTERLVLFQRRAAAAGSRFTTNGRDPASVKLLHLRRMSLQTAG